MFLHVFTLFLIVNSKVSDWRDYLCLEYRMNLIFSFGNVEITANKQPVVIVY